MHSSAVSQGYLDDVPVDRIRAWERGFHEHLSAHHGEVLERIRSEKDLTDEIEAELVAAIEDYGETFEAEESARRDAASSAAGEPAAAAAG